MTMLRYLMAPMIETDLYPDTVVVRYVYYSLDREEYRVHCCDTTMVCIRNLQFLNND